MRIIIINGPNLNLLGKREPEIYGSETFEDLVPAWTERFPELEIEYFQSNHEGKLLDKLHEVGFKADGIILNAGAFTHTSIALRDAISAISTPVIEVHISNVHSREEFRHHSYISAVCAGIIVGFGTEGYALALRYFINQAKG